MRFSEVGKVWKREKAGFWNLGVLVLDGGGAGLRAASLQCRTQAEQRRAAPGGGHPGETRARGWHSGGGSLGRASGGKAGSHDSRYNPLVLIKRLNKDGIRVKFWVTTGAVWGGHPGQKRVKRWTKLHLSLGRASRLNFGPMAVKPGQFWGEGILFKPRPTRDRLLEGYPSQKSDPGFVWFLSTQAGRNPGFVDPALCKLLRAETSTRGERQPAPKSKTKTKTTNKTSIRAKKTSKV